MSADTLAALLWDGYTAADCWKDNGPAGGSTLDPDKFAAWLVERGVVVLPPEPTEEMVEVAINVLPERKFTPHAPYGGTMQPELSHDEMRVALRAAMAVLRSSETPK